VAARVPSAEDWRIVLHGDARAFLARAEPWLRAAEMERAVALRSAEFARTDDSQFVRPLYWATVEDPRGAIAGCAFRTPPYRLGLTSLPLAALPALVDSVASVYDALSGVAGPEPGASAFTAAWTERRGGTWTVQARQHLLLHKAIVPTRDLPPGSLRPGRSTDAQLAHDWGAAFARESGLRGLDAGFCIQLLRARQIFFWDDGTVRCLLGVLRETRDAAAIGIVYTPPAYRERGYATAAVSAFSRELLERGLPYSYFCLEPSSAAGYSLCHRLGYAVVQETADIDFRPR
jgi:hypothetical protein